MIDKIKKIAESELGSFHLRSSSPDIWEDIIRNSEYIPIDYTHETIEYRREFLKETSKEVLDFSLILIEEKKAIAVWPISITLNKYYEISCFGREIKEPIFSKKTLSIKKKNVIRKCFSFLKNLSNFLNIKFITISSSLKSKNLDYWGENCLTSCNDHSLKFNLFLNLMQSNDDVLKSLRPVYKNYYNSWKKNKFENFSPKILKHDDKNLWEKFKILHKKEAGRITRSNETWDIHYKNILKNKAFLSYIQKKDNNEFLGGAYFGLSRDEAYYGIGKYSQEYKKDRIPLGHLIQFAAIEEMMLRKIKFYKIGLLNSQIVNNSGLAQSKIDKVNLTQKEKNIGFFFKGFSSDIFPEIIFNINI